MDDFWAKTIFWTIFTIVLVAGTALIIYYSCFTGIDKMVCYGAEQDANLCCASQFIKSQYEALYEFLVNSKNFVNVMNGIEDGDVDIDLLYKYCTALMNQVMFFNIDKFSAYTTGTFSIKVQSISGGAINIIVTKQTTEPGVAGAGTEQIITSKIYFIIVLPNKSYNQLYNYPMTNTTQNLFDDTISYQYLYDRANTIYNTLSYLSDYPRIFLGYQDTSIIAYYLLNNSTNTTYKKAFGFGSTDTLISNRSATIYSNIIDATYPSDPWKKVMDPANTTIALESPQIVYEDMVDTCIKDYHLFVYYFNFTKVDTNEE